MRITSYTLPVSSPNEEPTMWIKKQNCCIDHYNRLEDINNRPNPTSSFSLSSPPLCYSAASLPSPSSSNSFSPPSPSFPPPYSSSILTVSIHTRTQIYTETRDDCHQAGAENT